MAELVFVHGAGDSAAIWDKQIERLGAAHDALALDLPGHGQRLNEAAFYDHEQNGVEVLRQVQQRGFGRPVLIGHSMGGAVVLSAVLSKPAIPRAVVLVASGARLRMPPNLVEAARQKAERAPPGQVGGSLVPLDVAVSASVSPETRAWLEARVGQSTAQATYADFLANDRFDLLVRLAEVTLPALVLAGEDDQMTPPKFQSFLAERLGNARLTLLPDAGHYVHVEQAPAFNQELEQFLSGLAET